MGHAPPFISSSGWLILYLDDAMLQMDRITRRSRRFVIPSVPYFTLLATDLSLFALRIRTLYELPTNGSCSCMYTRSRHLLQGERVYECLFRVSYLGESDKRYMQPTGHFKMIYVKYDTHVQEYF
jgi:hypothetical protein